MTETPAMHAMHTPGPWMWDFDSQGFASLVHPLRGHLVVMDFVRKGMGGAQPRFARWEGIWTGVERWRMGGVMHTVDEYTRHPDMALIAAAPELLAALRPFVDRCDPDVFVAELAVARAVIATAKGGAR